MIMGEGDTGFGALKRSRKRTRAGEQADVSCRVVPGVVLNVVYMTGPRRMFVPMDLPRRASWEGDNSVRQFPRGPTTDPSPHPCGPTAGRFSSEITLKELEACYHLVSWSPGDGS